jgi:plasmid stabilization system protein ParE
MKLKWSLNAKNDLEEIYNFYLLKNPAVAVRIHNSILDEALRLIKWPEIGKHEIWIEKKGTEFLFRSLVTKNGLFKIIYFLNEETVFISRIWNCLKDPNDLRL